MPSHISRYTPRLVTRIDFGFDQCSVVSFVIKKLFFQFIYGERVYILSYTDVLHANIFNYDLGINLQIFFVFLNFLLTINTTLTIRKEKFWEDSKLNLKGSNVSLTMSSNPSYFSLNPIHYGLFQGCSRMGRGGGGKKRPLPKICHTYPTMMKIDTIIPYLKKIQNIYESCDTLPEFCWHQHFFTEKPVNFAILRNTDIDWILIHNF